MATPSAAPLSMKQMRRVLWSPGIVLAIETKEDVWILAQIVDGAHIAFFKAFAKARKFSQRDWYDADLLCVKRGSKFFLRDSNCYVVSVEPKAVAVPTTWINTKLSPCYRNVVLWKGTQNERRLRVEYAGSLIDNDLNILTPRIRINDTKTIDGNELVGTTTFPYTNYRFFLCYQLNQNADPEKELVFRRPLPIDYKFVIDLLYREDQF